MCSAVKDTNQLDLQITAFDKMKKIGCKFFVYLVTFD